MSSRGNLWKLLPVGLRRLPSDLAAIVVWTVLTAGSTLLPIISDTPLRIILGLPFVLFVPGYAFICALFPEAGTQTTNSAQSETPVPYADDQGEQPPPTDDQIRTQADTGIDGIERVALSFGTSIAIVPLIGLVLNFTPFGIRLGPIVASIGSFVLFTTAVAARRRHALPTDEQFCVPYRSWISSTRSELLSPETRTDAALNVLLVLSVLLAVGSVGYAVAVPKEGESFSEFYLLTETDDGEMVADEYPTSLTQRTSAPLVVGVTNNEYRRINYTVVVQLQRVSVDNESIANDSAVFETGRANQTTNLQVTEREQLERFTTTLRHNETWQQQHEITPTLTGSNLRLQYLLYRDRPPAVPGEDTAYRSLHLWVNVSTAAT